MARNGPACYSTDEAKKVFAEAIAMAGEYRAGLEQLSAAVQAGKDDEAGRLTAQLREKRPELWQYAAILPTYVELDQAKTMQAEGGKDNPDLNARYQRIIDLLTKRLDLQNQIGAANRELFKERQALQQVHPECARQRARRRAAEAGAEARAEIHRQAQRRDVSRR